MDFSALYEKIKEYNVIAIFGHVRPDGDCYGSLNGLKNIILTTYPNKTVYCLTTHVEFLSFVGRMDDIEDEVLTNALAIVCDTSTRERIADQRYKICKEIIKVDHHLIIDNYGNYNIVDENIAATSLLIAKFLFTYKDLKITSAGATALYTGIISDTSNFRYRGINHQTFDLAGKLVDLGVDVEFVDANMSTELLRTAKLKSFIYRAMKVTQNGVVYARLSKTVIDLYQVTYDEASSLVSLLANIKECPVWILFIGYPKEIRVRIRSNGPDINVLAEAYGGGGHQKAAGATFKKWRTTNEFVKEADKLVKCYKDNIPYEYKRSKREKIK